MTMAIGIWRLEYQSYNHTLPWQLVRGFHIARHCSGHQQRYTFEHQNGFLEAARKQKYTKKMDNGQHK